MNIDIYCIGGLKEDYLRGAETEYMKRLTPYCKVSVTEFREARLPQGAGPAEEENVRFREGETLVAAVEKQGREAYVIALDMRGRQLTSEGFAQKIGDLALSGRSSMIFLVGGSLGLSEQVRNRANDVLSFSDMTFPHQLARIILLEQLYRAQKILHGEPYHK